jgi:16S rRNA (guanine1207-N2)-methyltransferase
MPHYFDRVSATPSRPGRLELVLPDWKAELNTDRGVFSAAAVDAGTLELLKAALPAPPERSELLDLGCGYGPIALTLAHRHPGCTVWAVDINERAVHLTATNADALGLRNVRAVQPDSVPHGVRFAQVWSNPPIRIGKAALHELLSTWLSRLAPGGEASLVVQKHLGSDSLAEWLHQAGYAVERVGSKKGYRLLRVGL